MKKLNVSVVVPVKNSEDTIDECIDSILELDSTDLNLEVVVVDNNSNDTTRRHLESYGNRIRLLHESEPGASAARNRGILACGHEFIAFTDADCVVDEKWLQFLIPPLLDESVGAVGGSIDAYNPANPVERFGEVICDHNTAINSARLPYVMSGNCALRKSVLVNIGLFDNELKGGHDVDLAWRLGSWGYALLFAPEARIRHHHRDSLWSLFGQGYEHAYWAPKLMKKHRELVKESGYSRFSWSSTNTLNWYRNRHFESDNESNFYRMIMGIGKKLGSLVGSMRFAHWNW